MFPLFIIALKISHFRCVLGTSRCSGNPECEDGSDEDDCDYHSDSDTETSEAAEAGARLSCDGQNLLSCGASDQCVHRDWVCDGEDDCGDRSDERDCTEQTTCYQEDFRCSDGSCIPVVWQCDGKI